MRTAALVLLLALPGAARAQAEPCVGASFDRPLPGASSVERRFADVPTARYPGIWQEGRVSGYFYQLSSDISGLLAPGRAAPEWRVTILCDVAAGRCERQEHGPVPEAARPVAEALGGCLLGAPVAAVYFDSGAATAAERQGLPPDAGLTGEGRAIDPAAGLATAAGRVGARRSPAEDAARPADAGEGADRPAAFRAGEGRAGPDLPPGAFNPTLRPPETCGLDAITEDGPPVLTLQRLLASGGWNPGPMDGLMGARTRAALVEALGPGAGDLDTDAALDALDAALCGA